MADTMPWEDYAKPEDGPWNDFKPGAPAATAKLPAQAPGPTLSGALKETIKTLPGDIIKGYAGEASDLSQAITTPLTRTLPGVSGQMQKLQDLYAAGADPLNPMTGPKMKAASGLASGIVENLESFASPLGFATMTMRAPRAIQGVLGTAFAIMGLRQAGEAGQQLIQAYKEKDWGKVAKLATEIAGGIAQTGLGTHQAIQGGMGTVNQIRGIPESADILPRAKQAVDAIKQTGNVTPNEQSQFGVFGRDSGRGRNVDRVIQTARGISSALRKGNSDDLQYILTSTGMDSKEVGRLNSLLPKKELAALQAIRDASLRGRSISDAAKEAIALFNSQKETSSTPDKISANETEGDSGEKTGSEPTSSELQAKTSGQTKTSQQERDLENASKNTKTATLYGSLRTFSRESEGKMPVKEGGGGIQPPAQEVAKTPQVSLSSPQDVSSLAAMPLGEFNAHIKTRPGGLTGDAYRLGQAAKTPEDLKAIQDAQAAATAEVQAAKQKGDFTTGMQAAMRGMYFREAYEAATGTGSAGYALRQANPDYKPPFPETKAPQGGTKPPTFTPAVKGSSGKIYTGADHPTARAAAKAAGETSAPRGYVDENGNFVTMLDAARRQMTTPTKPAEAPTTKAESATKTPEAPPSVQLDPEHQAFLDEERKAIDHPVEVVSGPINSDDPFAKQIATIDRKTGKILINPQELSAWLKNRGRGGVPAGQERAAIRSLLGEEAIHLATPDDAALAYHNSLTAAERAIGQRVYGGPGGQALSPTMLGHEMLRMRLQQLARIGVRETLEASTRERWTVKSLLALSDAIRTARETLGTKASKEGRGIIDQIQSNLDAALAKKGGGTLEEPAARRKQPEEKTPQFFLPPINEPVERPAASELGALPEVKIPPEQALKTDTILWNKPNAWRRVTSELLHKPFSLGKMLTEGSRATESDPVSTTRRLVALEKNGKVDVVSIYPDAEDGARAVDPAYAGKRARPNVPLKSLLDEGYKPIVSMLRTEGVQNFHRHFDSIQHFEDTVGKPGDDQWANVRGYEAQTAATQAPSFGKGTEMTDSEAGALHDHFIEHPNVEAAADAIAASPKVRQIRSAMSKAIHQIMAKDSSLTREEAAGKAMEELYEQSQSAEHRNDFIKGALGSFGQESPESAGHVPGETVNDLGQQQPTEENSTPAATRKFAQDQIKLTDEHIRAYVSAGAVKDTIARGYDAASNIPNILAAREENGVRLQSAEKPKSPLERLTKQWAKGKKEVLSGANALVQAQAVRDNGTIDNARKGQIPIFKALVQKGITEAESWTKSQDWRQRRMGEAWLRSQRELMAELDYADTHWNDPELQATAARMKQSLDEQWKREKQAGFEVSKDINYVPQRYDAAVWNEHSILFNAIEGTEKILGDKFRKPRTFSTYYEASSEGPYIPVTRDGASLVGHRVRQGMNMISRDAWANGLKGITGPSGQPVAVDAKINASGNLQPPSSRDYSNMLINNKNIAVHDDFKGLVDNLTSPSKVENWPVTRAALRLEQMMKHGLLLGDFFHLGRMGYYAASIMGKDAGWRGGWSVLDIKPQDIPQAVQRGIISPEDAAWGNGQIQYGNSSITRRQLAQKFVGSGANLGKIQDALYKDLITDLTPAASPLARGLNRVIDPSVGRYNRFLFDKLTRGLMTEANVREFERQSKANPNADPEALVRDISRDVNNYFGNIGRQGWMKSATQKDLARLLLLAPDWLEGLIKKDAVTYGRASGIAKLSGAREGLSNLGTTGRGIGRGLVFLIGLTQAVNLITRRQPTWKNEEKGHKFDAWIPGIGKDSEGFWFNPLSVFNEITHDVWRYSQTSKTVLEAVDHVAGNKESPLTRAVLLTLLGSGQLGPKPTTTASQIAGAAKQLAPMPLTFGRYAQAAGHAVAPSLVRPTPPGALQRQTFASLGLKIEPKQSPVQEISQKAQDFAKDNGFSKETGWQQVETDEPSYSKLRSALRAGDEAEAKRQYEALQKNRTNKEIFHSMKLSSKRPFTGSKGGEKAFLASLNDQGLAAYYKALDQRQKEYQAFVDFALRQ